MKVLFTSRAARSFYFISAALAAGVLMNAGFSDLLAPVVSAQTDRYLESRINMIEQRFYGIESRLNRVEQPSVRPSIVPQPAADQSAEIQYLRGQIDSLRTRVGELECSLLRVDERTLSAAARARRVKVAGSPSERCRLDNGEAIQLSARP